MTTYKPIFMRPVEIVTGTNDTIKVKASGAGSYVSYVINSGVYSCVFDVIWEFYAKMHAAIGKPTSATIEDGGDTDGKYCYIKMGFGTDYVMLIEQEATGRMLGWGRDTTTAVTATTISFNHQPEYCWIPRYQVANQGRFYRHLDEEFSGNKTKDGNLSGTTTGPTLNYRDLEFQNENAFNLYEEAAVGELYDDRSDTTKNLAHFVNQAQSCFPSVAGNPSPRGFWYCPDWNNVLGDISGGIKSPGAYNASSDDYGIRFDLATSPDLWEFCQFEENAIEPPTDIGVPTGRTLYSQANMPIHTADHPTFQATSDSSD